MSTSKNYQTRKIEPKIQINFLSFDLAKLLIDPWGQLFNDDPFGYLFR